MVRILSLCTLLVVFAAGEASAESLHLGARIGVTNASATCPGNTVRALPNLVVVHHSQVVREEIAAIQRYTDRWHPRLVPGQVASQFNEWNEKALEHALYYDGQTILGLRLLARELAQVVALRIQQVIPAGCVFRQATLVALSPADQQVATYNFAALNHAASVLPELYGFLGTNGSFQASAIVPDLFSLNNGDSAEKLMLPRMRVFDFVR